MTTPTPTAAPAAPPSSSASTTPNAGGAQGGPPPSGGTPAQGAPAGGKGGQGAPAQPPPPSRHKWTDKVNGREMEFEATDEELRAAWRHSRAANERFEQAARARKEAEQLSRSTLEKIGKLKNEPKAVLQLLREAGVEQPVDVLAELLQSELVELEQNQDPNVRRARKAEEELERVKSQREKEEHQRKVQEFEAKVDAETTRIEGLFTEALAKLDLPKDADTLRIMAHLESTNRRMGLKLTPEQLAAKTEDYVRGRALKLLLKMDPEKLYALNPEFTAAMRKVIVRKYKEARGKTTPNQQQGDIGMPPPKPKQEGEKGPKLVTDAEEFAQMMGGRKGLRSL